MIELVPILAVETSDTVCGACIYFGKEKYFSSKINNQYSHSEKIFELIETVLKHSGINKNELKAIAVSSGPGSFTGLRIGFAAVKGLAQSLKIPVISVPTFEALAFQVSTFNPDQSEFCIVNKVGRDELYFAKFQIKTNSYIFKEELKIIQYSGLEELISGIKIFGNIDNINSVSSGNFIRISSPDPEYIAQWALYFGNAINYSDIDFIEPNYIKEFVVKEKKHV